MLLSDRSIRELLDSGVLLIYPLRFDSIQPASVDVCLDVDLCSVDGEMRYQTPYVLRPGAFILGSTVEYFVLPSDLAARLDGRSSLGRRGLLVHATAGYIDPGFSGNLTVELLNATRKPICLLPHMPVAQVSFMRLSTPADRPYGSPGLGSRYQGQRGVTPAR